MQATRRCATAGRSINGLRLRAPLAAAIATAALFGCAEYRHDGYAMAPGSSPVRSTKRAAPARISLAAPLAAHEAKAPLEERVLTGENEAKFVVLHDTEAIGRSRSFNGGQSNPDTCAAQCLAQSGCDAFSFAKETKVCYLVTQVTELSTDASFVSGRLR
ncbi:MAG: PAN domain-containing protein [Hyphomicrobiaceae bacterium]